MASEKQDFCMSLRPWPKDGTRTKVSIRTLGPLTTGNLVAAAAEVGDLSPRKRETKSPHIMALLLALKRHPLAGTLLHNDAIVACHQGLVHPLFLKLPIPIRNRRKSLVILAEALHLFRQNQGLGTSLQARLLVISRATLVRMIPDLATGKPKKQIAETTGVFTSLGRVQTLELLGTVPMSARKRRIAIETLRPINTEDARLHLYHRRDSARLPTSRALL